MIRDVCESDLGRVRAFLEAHLDSSLFLLSNLAMFGPQAGLHPNSGCYRLVEEDAQIAAVFCLTLRGNLLVQAAGRVDLAEPILRACDADCVQVSGVLGDWLTTQALWNLICADAEFEPKLSARDLLYGRRLTGKPGSAAGGGAVASVAVRQLGGDDFAQWEPLNSSYLAELQQPPQSTLEHRRDDFENLARTQRWWGAFVAGQLVSIAGLNAVYGRLGQIGGVFTQAAHRRQGFARAVLATLINDCRRRHRFQRLVLFAGENNVGARQLYESLGFEPGAAFGQFLGTRHAHFRMQTRHAWSGQSGEVYTYEIHRWPTRLSAIPGNFIFARGDGAGTWRPLAAGETADLSALSGMEQLHTGHPAATHVHVRPNFNPAAVRRREAADIQTTWEGLDPALIKT